MSQYVNEAIELRASKAPHYNCAQAVVIPFAEKAGMSREVAQNIASNFGSGMKRAATCGSIAGGLMVLGMYGIEEPHVISDYYKRLKTNHNGHLECAPLLQLNKEKGGDKKEHCDDMVVECVKLVREILIEHGKIAE